jgi:hypothetical protein
LAFEQTEGGARPDQASAFGVKSSRPVTLDSSQLSKSTRFSQTGQAIFFTRFLLSETLSLADIPHIPPRSQLWFTGRCISPLQHSDRRSQLMQHNRARAFDNLCQIRQFVTCTLCQKNDFEIGVFEITERLLTRRGRPCGVYFCLNGPRSVKLTAIWDTERNSILFYGSTGERFQTTKLDNSSQTIDPSEIAELVQH